MGICASCRKASLEDIKAGTEDKLQELDIWKHDAFVSAYHKQSENFFVKKRQVAGVDVPISNVEFSSWK